VDLQRQGAGKDERTKQDYSCEIKFRIKFYLLLFLNFHIYLTFKFEPIDLTQAVTILTCFQEVFGSNLGRGTTILNEIIRTSS
jgi:hypothetical protein